MDFMTLTNIRLQTNKKHGKGVRDYTHTHTSENLYTYAHNYIICTEQTMEI